MKSLFLSLISLTTTSIFAASPQFDAIDQDDFNKISKEFGANAVHALVAPANPLGEIFGVEAGINAGATKTPEIEKLVKEQDSSVSIGAIPHANLFAAVSIPFGLTFELTYLPSADLGDVSVGGNSQAIKWNFDRILFPKIPILNMALRVHRSNFNLDFDQTINNSSTGNVDVSSTIDLDTTTWGAHLIAGANLFIFKPYAGFGYVSTKTELDVDASTGTIFDTSFSSNQKESKSHSGTHYFVGSELDLLLLHIGIEYAKIMDIDRYTAKFSLAF